MLISKNMDVAINSTPKSLETLVSFCETTIIRFKDFTKESPNTLVLSKNNFYMIKDIDSFLLNFDCIEKVLLKDEYDKESCLFATKMK